MKLHFGLATWALLASTTAAFCPTPSQRSVAATTALHMVLEKPVEKKLPKIEQLKVDSDHLLEPLKEVGVDDDDDSCMDYCVNFFEAIQIVWVGVPIGSCRGATYSTTNQSINQPRQHTMLSPK